MRDLYLERDVRALSLGLGPPGRARARSLVERADLAGMRRMLRSFELGRRVDRALRDQRGGFPTWPFTLGSSVAPGMHDSLIAYYLLGEASGSRADSFGSNTLTDNNTVTQAAGIQGNAAQFTLANSEFLSIADNAAFSMGDIAMSMAGWVYHDNLAVNHAIAAKWTTVGDIREYRVYSNPTNFAWQVSGNGIAATNKASADALSAATWYFVVVDHDPVADTISIQVNNGTQESGAHATGIYNGTSDFRLGNDETGGDFHNGRVDEWGVWKRLLTQAERDYLWNGGAGRTYPLTTP